jgi:CRP/FNR family transcriptional regulator, cyclic AMP receptor protein
MSQMAAGSAARAAMSVPGDPTRMGRDWVPVLADVPLFRNLSRRHVKRVASLARTRRFAAGTAIVHAGDEASTFFVLIDGAARVVTPTGRRRRLQPGDFFGEMALLDDSPRSADVVADGEVLTLTISRTAFSKLLKREPALSYELLRTLAARLRAAEKSA